MDPYAGINTADIEPVSTASQGQTKSTPSRDEPLASSSSDDSWKVEYEAQVETWRAQSSKAREKAEKERKRWEELRELEREQAGRRPIEVPVVVKGEHEAGWETLPNNRKIESTVVSGLHTTDPADSGYSVTRVAEHQVRMFAFGFPALIVLIPPEGYSAGDEPRSTHSSPSDTFTPGRGVPEMGRPSFFRHVVIPVHVIP